MDPVSQTDKSTDPNDNQRCGLDCSRCKYTTICSIYQPMVCDKDAYIHLPTSKFYYNECRKCIDSPYVGCNGETITGCADPAYTFVDDKVNGVVDLVRNGARRRGNCVPFDLGPDVGYHMN